MLTQTLKNKLNQLWDKFWVGGIANPLNAIEQITYLLFMKQLDETDKSQQSRADFSGETYISLFSGTYTPPGFKDEVEKDTLRWSSFCRMPADDMFTHVQGKVFPFIKELNGSNLFTKHMNNAAFLIPSGRLLTEAVKTIDEIYAELEKENRFIDAQGDFYEELLNGLSTAGRNGQFRTPTHIIEMMVELVQPQLGHRIADPACGTAGFLLASYKYIITQFTSPEHCVKDDNGFVRGSRADKLVDKRQQETLNANTFYGFDIDPTMIRIGLMNLMMHGITEPKIDYKDTLSKNYNEDGYYDIILANPPFTGSVDKGDLNESFSLNTTKSELLFLERIYKMLRMGGTAAVVVPQGVLFGSGNAFKDARKLLIDKCELKAVISMPSGVFKPYAGVATAILIFTKGGETNNVWFYEMKSDGRSLDDKRTELSNPDGTRNFGDLHKIVEAYKNKNQKDPKINDSDNFFIIPKNQIAENGYDLSLNKYKEGIYEQVIYDKPKVILKKLTDLEESISIGLNELETVFE